MPETEPKETLGLDQVAAATFRTSASTDEALKRLKDGLGFGAFNIPSRLAIARSLAIPGDPPPVQSDGRGIKGDTLKCHAERGKAVVIYWPPDDGQP